MIPRTQISRPKVVATVLDALDTAQILSNAREDAVLTERFRQIEEEDSQAGKPHFRIIIFIETLHENLRGHWVVAPSQLLSGLLRTPCEISDRILLPSASRTSI